MNEITLQKKVAVIVGATGYLGLELVKQLEKEGLCIAIFCRKGSEEKTRSILQLLPSAGHHVYTVDFFDESSIAAALNTVKDKQGTPYLCICTAGLKPLRKKILDTSYKEMVDQIEGTFFPAFLFLKEAGKFLKTQSSGVLVGVTTAGVKEVQATKNLGGYIAAKYALQGSLEMLRAELVGYGVKVYSVAPGFMEGGMNGDIPKAFVQMIKEKSSSKQVTTSNEVVSKIIMLCKSSELYPLTTILAPEYE